MKVHIEIDSERLKHLILGDIRTALGDVDVKLEDIKIEVQSRQNYRAHEWEKGDFRAVIDINK